MKSLWQSATRSVLYACLPGLLLPSAAHASDGVAEISHVCATQTGCFAGDTPGYPVTIDGSAGKSYRLTSDLVVPDAFTNGVVISSPATSIDLNGFEIARAGCEGTSTTCTVESGSGNGIADSPLFGVSGISVRNGSVRGMGSRGIGLGPNARVSEVRAGFNASRGISLGIGAVITDCHVHDNGGIGLFLFPGSSAGRCAARDNFSTGIQADRSTLWQNTASGNGGTAISAGTRSVVMQNSVTDNGGTGISASTGTNIRENSISNNTGVGLSLFSSASYSGNNLDGNTGGTVTGGLDLGGNVCNGVASCP